MCVCVCVREREEEEEEEKKKLEKKRKMMFVSVYVGRKESASLTRASYLRWPEIRTTLIKSLFVFITNN